MYRSDFCQNRTFHSMTDLGIHMRRAHSYELDAQQARVDRKIRWTEEELRMLARREAKLQLQCPSRHMNIALHESFQNRTVEFIKEQR